MGYIVKTERLKVLLDDNGTFIDVSDSALDYDRDSIQFDLVALEDALYIGDSKPINSLYLEMSEANTSASIFTIEYWDGSVWVAVSNIFDRTKGANRSGFISWDKTATSDESTGHQESTVDGTSKFWFKITSDSDFSIGTIIQGLNIVFSDDQDLKEEYYDIDQYYPEGATSFILKHVASRNEIIQDIRNKSKLRVDLSVNNLNDVNAFTLHNFEQVRQASKFLTLYKIFFNISNSVEDSMFLRAKEYRKHYKDAIDLFFVELDYNKDGIVDDSEGPEVNEYYSGTMVRR